MTTEEYSEASPHSKVVVGCTSVGHFGHTHRIGVTRVNAINAPHANDADVHSPPFTPSSRPPCRRPGAALPSRTRRPVSRRGRRLGVSFRGSLPSGLLTIKQSREGESVETDGEARKRLAGVLVPAIPFVSARHHGPIERTNCTPQARRPCRSYSHASSSS